MNNKPLALIINGVPGDSVAQAKFNGWVDKGVRDLLARTGPQALNIRISNAVQPARDTQAETGERNTAQSDELTTEQRAEQYVSTDPAYKLKQLIVPSDVMTEIEAAIDAVQVETLVYDTWGLRKIEPFPRSALTSTGCRGPGKRLRLTV